MDESAMNQIFLSASIPSPNADRQPEKYYQTMDATAIRESILALTRVFLPDYTLVFGGHPAISPFILEIAKQFGNSAMQRVFIYQSEYFRDKIPRESQTFPNLIWTEKKNDRDISLEHMRKEMITMLHMRKKSIFNTNYLAGFFIGGMDGVEKEYDLFRQLRPSSPVFPIASTGAAAKVLLNRNPNHPSDQNLRKMLEEELAYRYLFKTIKKGLI